MTRKAGLFFLVCMVWVAEVQSRAETCLSPPGLNLQQLEIDKDMLSKMTVETRLNYLNRFETQVQLTAKALRTFYFQDKLEASFLQHCLPSVEERSDFYDWLSKEFQEYSLTKMSESSLPSLQTLAKKLEGKLVFRAVGHYKKLGTRKAEFHRTRRSIFTDLSRIKAEEWLIIFIHEIVHWYDQQLFTSSQAFADKTVATEIFEMAKSVKYPQQLSLDQWRLVREHILHGLNRGFLAEFRAWTVTFSIYQQMKQASEQEHVEWIERILLNKWPNESMAEFVYRYLEPNFTAPKKESIFQLELMQNSYRVVKDVLRKKNKVELLGKLSRITESDF